MTLYTLTQSSSLRKVRAAAAVIASCQLCTLGMLPRLGLRAPIRHAGSSLRYAGAAPSTWSPSLSGPRYFITPTRTRTRLAPFSSSSARLATESRRAHEPTQSTNAVATAAPTAATPSFPIPKWAEKLPKSLRWTHPYLSLARMDKPIGTWLLYWPCGERYTPSSFGTRGSRG